MLYSSSCCSLHGIHFTSLNRHFSHSTGLSLSSAFSDQIILTTCSAPPPTLLHSIAGSILRLTLSPFLDRIPTPTLLPVISRAVIADNVFTVCECALVPLSPKFLDRRFYLFDASSTARALSLSIYIS